MKSAFIAAIGTLIAQQVAAHAIFQALWVNSIDYAAQCVRLPASNSPVVDVTSKDIVCNVGAKSVNAKCPVKAGDTVTIEMHQQPGDRGCNSEAIGGAHYGPVSVYLTKVDDATTADGSTGWFKIFEDSWAKKPSSSIGDDDFWGTKDLNTCCGKMDILIPKDLKDGDYLLRAEALALHTASSSKGAQFYMSCYQITVSGGSGTANPSTVNFPGAYPQNHPGILVNIHAALQTYQAPGPTVYSGGSTKSAGSSCRSGCESTCTAGVGGQGTASTVVAAPTTTGGGSGGCSVQQWQQCGGIGWSGCTNCAVGSCVNLNPYYYQCQ